MSPYALVININKKYFRLKFTFKIRILFFADAENTSLIKIFKLHFFGKLLCLYLT